MKGIEKGIYNRNELLLGEGFMHYLMQRRVIIFGVGGVGSWCAESLVRTGICHLTIVHSDLVCITKHNTHNIATTNTDPTHKLETLLYAHCAISSSGPRPSARDVSYASIAKSNH